MKNTLTLYGARIASEQGYAVVVTMKNLTSTPDWATRGNEMDTNLIRELTDDLRLLRSAEFRLINGWGRMRFSPTELRAYDGGVNGSTANKLIKRLNDAIAPVIEEEVKRIEAAIRAEAAREE